jgi:AP-3 complex subunit delta-1
VSDLVRGIRACQNKEDENAFVSVCLQEIKNELSVHDPNLKANAVQKLCYVCNLVLP